MATSISKSVNYKQAAAAPDYQVAARPVDTFVSGSGNDTLSKGRQVAAALEQASGALVTVKKTQDKEAEKDERIATALQKDQARVAATREAAEFNEAQKSQNYDEDSTYESIFGSVYSDEEAQARYDAATEQFKDNPEALAVFQNTFRMSTEAPLIEAIGESVQQQRSDTIAGLLPTVYQEALTNNPNNKEAAFRSTEAQLFKRLTDSPEEGGYGIKNSIAADMLGSIFLSETLKRDSEGRANTFMAEQYILSGKGSNEMRDKLTTAVLNQQRYAAQERGTKRTEDAIAEEAQTNAIKADLASGEYKTTDSNILARNDLTDKQKLTLIGFNQQVKEQQRIAADPKRKAEAKKLLLKTKRDLRKAAISGDFTGFGFAEGEIPTAAELEATLTDSFFGQMANENDFNELVASAANSLSINDYIDREGSDKILKTQFNQLQSQFESKRFTRNMRKYSQEVLDNQPVETYLAGEFRRVTHELVEDYVASGKDLTSAALSLIYEQAATKVMQPITDYANSSFEERKEILAGNENLAEQTSLIEPDEVALQQWAIHNQDPEFLEMWDQKYIRPETQPEQKQPKLTQFNTYDLDRLYLEYDQIKESSDRKPERGDFGKGIHNDGAFKKATTKFNREQELKNIFNKDYEGGEKGYLEDLIKRSKEYLAKGQIYDPSLLEGEKGFFSGDMFGLDDRKTTNTGEEPSAFANREVALRDFFYDGEQQKMEDFIKELEEKLLKMNE